MLFHAYQVWPLHSTSNITCRFYTAKVEYNAKKWKNTRQRTNKRLECVTNNECITIANSIGVDLHITPRGIALVLVTKTFKKTHLTYKLYYHGIAATAGFFVIMSIQNNSSRFPQWSQNGWTIMTLVTPCDIASGRWLIYRGSCFFSSATHDIASIPCYPHESKLPKFGRVRLCKPVRTGLEIDWL